MSMKQTMTLTEKEQASMVSLLSKLMLSEIATYIRRYWENVYFGAAPYLEAMECLDNIRDNYGADTGSSIVAYFLANATQWRGPIARAVKAELKKRLKNK